MAAPLPEHPVEHDRGLGLHVPGRPVLLRQYSSSVFQTSIPLAWKKGMPGGLVVEAEQIQRLAELAVVPFLGLFDEVEICFSSFLSKKAVP